MSDPVIRRNIVGSRRRSRVLGGIGLTYLQSLSSPVYYGITIRWGVLALPLETGVAGVIALVLAAAAYPMIHSSRLETADVLRTS